MDISRCYTLLLCLRCSSFVAATWTAERRPREREIRQKDKTETEAI